MRPMGRAITAWVLTTVLVLLPGVALADAQQGTPAENAPAPVETNPVPTETKPAPAQTKPKDLTFARPRASTSPCE